MSEEPKPAAKDPLEIDLEASRALLAVLGGERVHYCYQCGACVGDCASARFHPGFNPREIMLTAILGGLDELLAPGSVIWKCSNCYNCYQRCPQDVRPIEVILALKNLAGERGAAPPEARAVYETIVKTGRSAPVIAGLDRKRASLGLPPLAPVDVAEIEKLLAPDEAPEADSEAAHREARKPGPEAAPDRAAGEGGRA